MLVEIQSQKQLFLLQIQVEILLQVICFLLILVHITKLLFLIILLNVHIQKSYAVLLISDASGNPVTQSVVGITDSSGNSVTGKRFNQFYV